MSLFDRLRGNQQPVQLSAPPGDPKAVLDEHRAVELAAARAQIASLAMQLTDARAYSREAGRRAVDAEQACRELRVALAGGTAAGYAHALDALRRYEDLLEGCRLAHKTNVRASALPSPLAVCQWCHQPVAGPLDACDEPDCQYQDARLAALFRGQPERDAALAERKA